MIEIYKSENEGEAGTIESFFELQEGIDCVLTRQQVSPYPNLDDGWGVLEVQADQIKQARRLSSLVSGWARGRIKLQGEQSLSSTRRSL